MQLMWYYLIIEERSIVYYNPHHHHYITVATLADVVYTVITLEHMPMLWSLLS